jgi:hypothetical protein
MPDLETFLAQWRQKLSAVRHLKPGTLDELESHLRDRIAEHMRSGLAEADACQRAAAELGSMESIAGEFRKLDRAAWLPAKMVVGMGMALPLILAALLLARSLTRPGAGVLLSVHIFTVTLGYTATLLLGVLGACFVLQRARGEFSPRCAMSLGRITLIFATVAAICTATGVILGGFWALREWGRFWDWDAKEIGGFCAVIWMTGFLVAHAFRWVTTRGLLVASMIGSNVVFLAWFGPALAPGSGLHAYGLPGFARALLLGVLIGNLLLALLGLAPAGCLRARKA